MNLYKFHAKPESLNHYQIVSETNPEVFWEKYKNNPIELKKREKYIAENTLYSYKYAVDVLKGPFPAGEEAISKVAEYACEYARYALKGPFPAGEAAIATDIFCSEDYAIDVLKKDFYLDGKLIAKI